MIRRRRATLALALALAAGCGSTLTAHAIIGESAAAHARAVPVYLVAQAVPRNYVEVALVQANGRGDQGDASHALDGLRREAQSLGADAVIAARVDVGTTQCAAVGVAVRWIAGPAPALGATRAPWTPANAPANAPANMPGSQAPWSVPAE